MSRSTPSPTLERIPLECGHDRHVEPGLARMIAAGHITTQTCLTCREPAQVAA